ncbi:FT-interacting protein 1-like [Actinidia eriantha]|uniref:FT-interacting protein 1-like n=1 Tax=Actinidia eriantha TaxID=165200 RepID=UPI0025851969|nr:FT-interacting protein 1-like [Actinidia eriantha]
MPDETCTIGVELAIHVADRETFNVLEQTLVPKSTKKQKLIFNLEIAQASRVMEQLFYSQKKEAVTLISKSSSGTTKGKPNTLRRERAPSGSKMHYLHPFPVNELDSLRYQAMRIVAVRIGRAEPPLRKEVVEYMLDVDSHMWSMRRSKANFFRIMSLFSGIISMSTWLGEVCHWKNPATSILVHVLLFILICYPELILPTIFLYMFLIGIRNFRFRPRHPPHMDTKLSWAEAVNLDELDEEFDTFPTSKQQDVVQMRYDRIRGVAGRIQTMVGDMVTQGGGRFQALLSWKDPRVSSLFIVFCLCAAIVLWVTPFKIAVLVVGLYFLRHPRFRSKRPSVPSNFFRRLPARADSML